MTTCRRYHFTPPTSFETAEGGWDVVQLILARRCAQYWWFTEPLIEGEALGVLSFSFTVASRDQWDCHRRAMWLAGSCYLALGLPETQVPEPTWETLPPHTNRGYNRAPNGGWRSLRASQQLGEARLS